MNKFKKIAATSAVVVALGGGIALSEAPSDAIAHTGDITVAAECNHVTGFYDLTAKLTITQTGENGITVWRIGNDSFEGTPTSPVGLDLGPVASVGAETIVLGTYSVPGYSTQAPWIYAYTKWLPDNFTHGSDGGDITLAGDCIVPTPGDTPTPTPTPTPTVTPTPEPTNVPVPFVTPPPELPVPVLANTGSGFLPYSLAVVGLLLLGFLLIAISRKL